MNTKNTDLDGLLESKAKDALNDEDIDSDGLERQKLLFEIDSLKKRNARFEQNTVDRKKLTKWASWLVSVWLLFVAFLLLTNQSLDFGLTDPVLIALLGTTTLNVLGLMLIVLQGYFKGGEN